MDTTTSQALFERAQRVIPGGVNSPVRAFASVGGTPRFMRRGQGTHVEDEDGNRYIDLVGSWGPLALGHAHPDVVRAAVDAIERGSSFGASTRAEVLLAEKIVAMMPSIEKVRLVNSGTEAAMTAVRLARGVTGRSKILKFAGHYHGHSDSLLVAAGSGLATLGIPGSPGVTPGTAADTIVVPWNDTDAVSAAVSDHGDDLAAIICEPVAANMNLVLPQDGFLAELRGAADRCGALLVFDEVITGFRMGPEGAQGHFGVSPDLTVLGKVIGGGFPLAAVGGAATVMDHLAPVGTIYQAGTLSGNPVAVAAGLAQLGCLMPDTYVRLGNVTDRLASGLREAAETAGREVVVTQADTLAGMIFAAETAHDYDAVAAADHGAYAEFFHGMLERGVYLAPSGYEIIFTSTALTDELVDSVVEAAAEALAR